MKTHIVEPCCLAHAAPRLLDCDDVCAGSLAREHVRVALDAWETAQELGRRRIEIDHLRTGFRIGQLEQ